MRLGISDFEAGGKTIKFKTPLLLDIVEGPNIEGGVCVVHDGLGITANENTLLECDAAIREELNLLWIGYALAPSDELTKDALALKNKLLAMAVDTPKTFEIGKVRYPSLNRILMRYPNPETFLGHMIYWQEKRDGSNIGVYLNRTGDLALRSRNMDVASGDFRRIFLETDEAEKVKELLIYMQDDWNEECVVFGELLVKGKSPTRTEMHEKHEFVVFDIWSSKAGGFVPYMLVHQHCYHFDISIVELYGTSRHVTLDSLLKFRDEMLEIAKKSGREGVVGKTYEKGTMYQYFKEKLDSPKLERLPSHIEEGTPILPSLPESEILGGLDKVLVDIGFEAFMNVKKAMPAFAKYVGIECRKHNCCRPERKLFSYYRAKTEEIKNA